MKQNQKLIETQSHKLKSTTVPIYTEFEIENNRPQNRLQGPKSNVVNTKSNRDPNLPRTEIENNIPQNRQYKAGK